MVFYLLKSFTVFHPRRLLQAWSSKISPSPVVGVGDAGQTLEYVDGLLDQGLDVVKVREHQVGHGSMARHNETSR